MKKYYPADQRWWANHGWLRTAHSFSFASYYNPNQMNFWALRVLNDDRVSAWQGFGAHSHQDMEIISLVTAWSLKHQDDTGNKWIITVDDVQVMSAWSWVVHSEMNASDTHPVSFFQIWIETRTPWISPRYDQKHFDPTYRINQFQRLVSPDGSVWSLQIMQDAWISRISSPTWTSGSYTILWNSTWIFRFQISGSAEVAWQKLWERDAIAFTEIESTEYLLDSASDALVIEVPMD